MDHNQAVRDKATERYLLNELEPEVRDQFEEHLFDCQDCALDVRTAAMFVEQSKTVLSEEEAEKPAVAPAGVSAPAPASAGWFAWMRPAFVVPVLALLLVVIGYQSMTNSRLQGAAATPQVLASAVINVGVRGEASTQVPAHAGESFHLTLNVPPDHYSSYKLDLYSTQGALEWSRTVPASGGDTLSLYVPAGDRIPGGEPGALSVNGITTDGRSQDLGRYRIELQK
jgi:anti-sigma factor RsiW